MGCDTGIGLTRTECTWWAGRSGHCRCKGGSATKGHVIAGEADWGLVRAEWEPGDLWIERCGCYALGRGPSGLWDGLGDQFHLLGQIQFSSYIIMCMLLKKLAVTMWREHYNMNISSHVMEPVTRRGIFPPCLERPLLLEIRSSVISLLRSRFHKE